jgi:hypothetical protein
MFKLEMLSLRTSSLLKFSENKTVRSFVEILKKDQTLINTANDDFWTSYMMKFGKIGRLILWQRGDVKTSQEWLCLVESILKNEASMFCFMYNNIRDTVEKNAISVLDIPRNGTQLYLPIKCSILGYKPTEYTFGYLCKFWWIIRKYHDRDCKDQVRLILTSSFDDILLSTTVQRSSMYFYYLKKLLNVLEYSYNFKIETLEDMTITYRSVDKDLPKIKYHLSTRHSYDSLLSSIEDEYSDRSMEYQVDIKLKLCFGPSFHVEYGFKIHEIII